MVMYDIPTNQIDPHKIIQDFTNSVQAWKKLSKKEGLSEVDIQNTFNFLNQLDNDQKMQLVHEFNKQNLGSPQVNLSQLEQLSVEQIKAAQQKILKSEAMLEASDVLDCFDGITPFEKEIILEKMKKAD